MKKVMAISSIGGHWIQLQRLRPAFMDSDVFYVTTKQSFIDTIPSGTRFYSIPDGNRNDLLGLLKSVIAVVKIIAKEKPDVVITTGAAPGLIGIFLARLFGSYTIWIDSIANCEEISLSGRIATKISNKVYTQWSHLETSSIKYKGNILK
ncbi:oligosaccharide biosynthesis protein Alg14 [Algoriphagus sp.]|uniref:oligosaccharide biosynthesis protein Alg14 n=1 Tax=Algoriphagus sp. TaxID=1872435 RepID=UPI003F71FE1C